MIGSMTTDPKRRQVAAVQSWGSVAYRPPHTQLTARNGSGTDRHISSTRQRESVAHSLALRPCGSMGQMRTLPSRLPVRSAALRIRYVPPPIIEARLLAMTELSDAKIEQLLGT